MKQNVNAAGTYSVDLPVVDGRTLTSYPSVRTDIRNAGGTVVVVFATANTGRT